MSPYSRLDRNRKVTKVTKGPTILVPPDEAHETQNLTHKDACPLFDIFCGTILCWIQMLWSRRRGGSGWLNYRQFHTPGGMEIFSLSCVRDSSWCVQIKIRAVSIQVFGTPIQSVVFAIEIWLYTMESPSGLCSVGKMGCSLFTTRRSGNVRSEAGVGRGRKHTLIFGISYEARP